MKLNAAFVTIYAETYLSDCLLFYLHSRLFCYGFAYAFNKNFLTVFIIMYM